MGTCCGGLYSVCCCECNFMIFPAPTPSYPRGGDEKIIQYFGNKPYICLLSKNSNINIIYFHGNAEDIGYSLEFLTPIQKKLNANIYSLEYPTYGTYEVTFPARISNGIKEDALEFY